MRLGPCHSPMRRPLLQSLARRRPLWHAAPQRRPLLYSRRPMDSLRSMLVQRVGAWNPHLVRYVSLMQSVGQDPKDDAKKLEEALSAAAAAVGLQDFAADMLPALKVLAESLQMMEQSPAFQNWTSSDWLLGLTVMAQHNTLQRRKLRTSRADATAQTPTTPTERRELLHELLRFVRICDAVYADTTEQFCTEAKLPVETVVRSFNGGILSPKFLLLKNDETKEIVLVVRGTASILDFCTDICLVNEPFGDGQGHRGMVHSAKWLVKNVKADLERLTTENPEYQLVITGHSLGAGVSALTAMELKPSFPSLKCIAFATPASVTENLAHSCQDYVTTVVNGDDCVPRLHQHSMLRLQGEVSKFDWRATLKQMVDEEVEEQKSMVKRKRDEHIQQAYEAFQRLKESQEQQAQAKLMEVLSTPVGRRVSASLELTKAAFWTDQPAMERLVSIKQVVQKQKTTGDDKKLWESLEATVTGLENIARVMKKPEERQAVLTKSKVLLASSSGYDTKEEKDDGKQLPWTRFRDRVKTVMDKTTESLKTNVKGKLDEVTTSVEALKSETEAAIEAQAAKLEQSMAALQNDLEAQAAKLEQNVAAFQSDLEAQTAKLEQSVATLQSDLESIVKRTQETALNGDALGPLLKEFELVRHSEDDEDQTVWYAGDGDGIDGDEQDQVEAMGVSEVEGETPETSVPQELLHEPLFPPGRILYLNRLLLEAQQDCVELVDVGNDEFSRVVLSNNMILDHLCTTYERELQAAARAIEQVEKELEDTESSSKKL